MKVLVKSGIDESDITVKFKGQVYTDGKRDQFGHIRFGQNEFEYVPISNINRIPHVLIHGFKQKGNSYVHVQRKSTAKCEIVEA